MNEKYPVKNPDIVARADQKEALLFNPADGNMLCVNGTGILIWDLCDGTRVKGDIIKKITGDYDVTAKRATEDYDSFMKEMEEVGFIGYRT